MNFINLKFHLEEKFSGLKIQDLRDLTCCIIQPSDIWCFPTAQQGGTQFCSATQHLACSLVVFNRSEVTHFGFLPTLEEIYIVFGCMYLEDNIYSATVKPLIFYRTWKPIIVVTRTQHWTLSQARWIQPTKSNHISFRSSFYLVMLHYICIVLTY